MILFRTGEPSEQLERVLSWKITLPIAVRDRDRQTELSSRKRVKRGLVVYYIILLINIELIKFSPFINAILKALDAIKRH